MPHRDPAVRCRKCDYTWNSAAMADGLRLLPGCPRCGGSLEFDPRTAGPPAGAAVRPQAEPHLVLGLPRLPY